MILDFYNKHLTKIYLLSFVGLFFFLLSRESFDRGFDYYSFSRMGFSLLKGEGLRDLYGIHTHFTPLMGLIYAFFGLFLMPPDPLLLLFQVICFSFLLYTTHQIAKKISFSPLFAFTLIIALILSKDVIIFINGFTSEALYFSLLLLAVSPFLQPINSIPSKKILESSAIFGICFLVKHLAIFHFVFLIPLIFLKNIKKGLLYSIPFSLIVLGWMARSFIYGGSFSGRDSGSHSFSTFNSSAISKIFTKQVFEWALTDNHIFVFSICSIIILALIFTLYISRKYLSIFDCWNLLSVLGYIPFVLLSYYFFDYSVHYDERLAFPFHWHLIFLLALISNRLASQYSHHYKIRNFTRSCIIIFLAWRFYSTVPLLINHIQYASNSALTLIKKSPLGHKVLSLTEGRPLFFTNSFHYAIQVVPINGYLLSTTAGSFESIKEIASTYCRKNSCYRLELYRQGKFDTNLPSTDGHPWDSFFTREMLFSAKNGKLEQLFPKAQLP